MIEFVRTIWRELLGSLGESFALVRGGGVVAVDMGALAVRLLVSVLVVLLAWLVYLMARRILAWTLRRTRFPVSARGPLFLALRAVVTVLTFLAVLGQFGVSSVLLGDAALAAVFAFAFYLAWWTGNRVLQATVHRAGLDRSLRQLLRNVLAVTVASVGFVMVMGQFGVNVLAAITALGVVGIAVGFAAQETLSNFIAGITLLIERPFRLGEWVDLGGKVGRVEGIRLRTTLIVDRDNVHTIIPNAQVAKGQIVNLSGGGPLRLRIEVGIAYKESAAQAREVLLPVLRGHPEILRGDRYEPMVLVTGLGASSVDLAAFVWIPPEKIAVQPRISAELVESAKEALDREGIQIPFPHLQLFIDDAQGLAPVLAPLAPRPGSDRAAGGVNDPSPGPPDG
ncbi:MAG: mechanosensitive ion channel family protein [Trueperaceae bacterium]|nr:mechanosensitive ion channel family protein [Trueperaceae bacterium]